MKVETSILKPLYTFYDRYVNKSLFLPTHQQLRGDVWCKAKKQQWWDDIEKNEIISGCILTYTLKSDKKDNKTLYLNDGANRTIHSIIPFIEECKRLGKDYQSILYRCNIMEQQMQYDNEPQAIDHFVTANMGTTATPYELLSCKFITGLSEYEVVWKPIFERLNSSVESVLKGIGCKIATKRDDVHKSRRDNLAMFCRFITKDRTRWSPKVANKTVDPDKLKEHSELEARCVSAFTELGSLEVVNQLEAFEKFLKEYTSLYHQIWLECGIPTTKVVSCMTLRWWLSVAIYHKNNNFDPRTLRDFTRKLTDKHKGNTTMVYFREDGTPSNINAQMSRVCSIGTILRTIDLKTDDFEIPLQSRTKPSYNLREGYVHSHIDAFSYTKQNETIPENAVDNRLRSARDMTQAEITILKKINKQEI